jgi:hypothetical protein
MGTNGKEGPGLSLFGSRQRPSTGLVRNANHWFRPREWAGYRQRQHTEEISTVTISTAVTTARDSLLSDNEQGRLSGRHPSGDPW